MYNFKNPILLCEKHVYIIDNFENPILDPILILALAALKSRFDIFNTDTAY